MAKEHRQIHFDPEKLDSLPRGRFLSLVESLTRQKLLGDVIVVPVEDEDTEASAMIEQEDEELLDSLGTMSEEEFLSYFDSVGAENYTGNTMWYALARASRGIEPDLFQNEEQHSGTAEAKVTRVLSLRKLAEVIKNQSIKKIPGIGPKRTMLLNDLVNVHLDKLKAEDIE